MSTSLPDTPSAVEEWIAQASPPQRQAVAALPEAPALLLEQLAKDEDVKVRWHVARNANTPIDVIWRRLAAKHPDAVVANPARHVWGAIAPGFLETVPLPALHAVLAQPDVPELWVRWTLEQTGREYQRVKGALGTNPKAPSWALQELWEQDVLNSRCLASHPQTSDDLLETLAASADDYTRACLARSPALPDDLMVRLTRDSCGAVRKRLASNPGLAKEAKTELLCDADWRIRRKLAERDDLQRPMTLLLLQDDKPEVRAAVLARSKTLPLFHLRWHSELDVPSVRRAARAAFHGRTA